MWVCVVITFSVVGFVWFRSTSQQFVALMHPEEEQARALAEANKPKQPSPFATILDSIDGLRANLSEFFGTSKTKSFEINNYMPNEEPAQPKKLPLSGDK